MIFSEITNEKELERLKRSIMKDEELYKRIEEVRKTQSYSNDGTTVWKKLAPYIGTGKKKMPSNAEMLALYKEMIESGEQLPVEKIENILRKIKVRSNSGVAVVSLLTKPYACPGRCIYCPTEKKMPKSYLSREPAAARALANKFDAYKQVINRLRALEVNGHPVGKIEIIVIGGTWSFYHKVYREEFIEEIFRACNNYKLESDVQIDKKEKTLLELQTINETGDTRIIGLSVETRPDHITVDELNHMRMLGVTKVEVGVQHLDDKVLEYNQREMTAESIAEVTELMRDAGLKVVYHMMPNLPGSTPEMDIKMFGDLFNSKDYHPDMLKMYPCMVLKKSKLYKIWAQGGFTAYTDPELIHVLREAKKQVPPYVRIIRVIRDIPADYIVAGSKISNLRQVIEEDQKKNNWRCECIRCREVRNEEVTMDDYKLSRIDYETVHGKEVFLSFENKQDHRCASFVRLRLPNGETAKTFDGDLEVLQGAALVRELHTYGQLKPVASEGDQSQHRGFGQRLMEEVAKISKEEGYKKIAVIAGVGVREYYKNKLGYHFDRTYMVKELD